MMGEVNEVQTPIGNNTNGNRSRALTTSSYASTAIPPQVESELDLGPADFGSSFDDMFSNFNKRQSTVMDGARFSAVRSVSKVPPMRNNSCGSPRISKLAGH